MQICYLAALFLLLASGTSQATQQTITLAYPERGKFPFIADSPSNAGLYFEVMQRASKMLNLQLHIERMPKKRIFQNIQEGKVDLYIGSFTSERSVHMNWINTGLFTTDTCVTRRETPLLNTLRAAPQMIAAVEAGSSEEETLKSYNQLTLLPISGDLTLKRAFDLLKLKRADIFIYNYDSLLQYLTQKHSSMTAEGLMAHPHCLDGRRELMLGVSRHSRLYSEIRNPDYQASNALSRDNLPTLINPDSVAGKLAVIIGTMVKQGEMETLYRKHLAKPQ